MAKETATYKVVPEGEGNRYLFFCDLTDAHLCTTVKVYAASSPEEALRQAWKEEGRRAFNQCHKCGRWVADVAYNAEVLECVACAPYECEPHFCRNCGIKIDSAAVACPSCGKPLVYKGGGS